MTNKSQRTVKCPTCQKSVTWSEVSLYRPFCSKRCKLIDLGEWASEGYRVVGEKASSDSDHEVDT